MLMAWGSNQGHPKPLEPHTLMRVTDDALRSWFQTGTAPANVAAWGVHQRMEHLPLGFPSYIFEIKINQS